MPVDKFLKEKENYILHILETKRKASLRELCAIFSMAPSSMRRRLADMERRGLLIRTHGGAASIDANRDESLVSKAAVNMDAKRAIALAAAGRVGPGDVVAIGGGTTTLEMCSHLAGMEGLIVLTNSLAAAEVLGDCAGVEVRLCGGIVRGRIGCVVGPSAGEFFRGARADKAFLGVDALNLERGVSSSSILIGEVEREMARCADTVYVLGDHSKINREVVSPFLSLDEVDFVIGDAAMPAGYVAALERSGPKVILAPVL